MTLIIDGANRMSDMGFIRDVRRIVAELPRERQSMLFSATMPSEVALLAAKILRDHPARIDISLARITADDIEQRVYFVAAHDKGALLAELLTDSTMEQVIVLTRTKHGAGKVAEVHGKAGHTVDAFHGNKSQNARQGALERFRAGRVRILPATELPRAAMTSTTRRMSSISSCRTSPKVMFTASAGRLVPEPQAQRLPSAMIRSAIRCVRSNASSGGRSPSSIMGAVRRCAIRRRRRNPGRLPSAGGRPVIAARARRPDQLQRGLQ